MKKQSTYWQKKTKPKQAVKDWKDNKGNFYTTKGEAQTASALNFVKGGLYSGFPILLGSWFWYAAIAIYPFVFIRKDYISSETINHEKIHIMQQKEMLVVFAYMWYVTELLLRITLMWSIKKAYDTHSMEREAKENQANADYIHNRRHYSFLKYI